MVYPLEALTFVCVLQKTGIFTRSLEQFTFTFPRDINHYEAMRRRESQIESSIHFKQMKINAVKTNSQISKKNMVAYIFIENLPLFFPQSIIWMHFS